MVDENESMAPKWSKRPLPKSIVRCKDSQANDYFQKFEGLVESRKCPSISFPEREIYWPNEELQARLIPEGILPLDKGDGYGHADALLQFFSRETPSGVVVWSAAAREQGAYRAKYSTEFTLWLRTELIASPIVVVSSNCDIVLIADEMQRFTVIGSNATTIAKLEGDFGGSDKLRAEVADWVDANSLGYGDSDREWAYMYPMRWSGWD